MTRIWTNGSGIPINAANLNGMETDIANPDGASAAAPKTKIQIRRDTAANWTSTNPVLAQGEVGLETDTGNFKIGDGTRAWNSLAYTFDGVTSQTLAPLQPRGLTATKLGIVLPAGTASFENWIVESPVVVFDPATQQWVMVYVAYSTLLPPSPNTPTTAATGGTIPASQTRYYKITSVNASGESTPSSEVTVTTGSTTSTNTVTVTWAADSLATGGYRVYVGTTPGGENAYFTVSSGTTFTDTGATGTAGQPPAASVAGTASVGMATSLDAINWTRTGTPILQGTGVSGDPDQYGTTGPVLWIENGTYYLFYIGLDASGYEAGTKRLMLATASSINGPWTRQGVMIAPTGTGWMSGAVYHASIVKGQNGTYYLFFNAATTGGNETIGYATATSPLGPWTVDNANSPVIGNGASGSWDSTLAGDPSIYRVGNTWYMAYYGYNGTNSQDGVAFTTAARFPLGWTKHPQNPILRVSASPSYDDTHAGKPFILPLPGAIYHYYTAVGTTQTTTAQRSIALAIDAPVQNAQPNLTPVQVPIVDNFTRPDSTTTLGQAPTGQQWVNLGTGIWRTVGDAAGPYALSSSNEAVCAINAGTPNGKTSVRITTIPATGTSFGLIFRMLDGNNFLYADIDATGVAITQRQSGGDTVIVAKVAGTNPAAGDVYAVNCYGPAITVMKNGATIISTNASFLSTTGNARGFRSYAGTNGQMAMDDFTVTPF